MQLNLFLLINILQDTIQIIDKQIFNKQQKNDYLPCFVYSKQGF